MIRRPRYFLPPRLRSAAWRAAGTALATARGICRPYHRDLGLTLFAAVVATNSRLEVEHRKVVGETLERAWRQQHGAPALPFALTRSKRPISSSRHSCRARMAT